MIITTICQSQEAFQITRTSGIRVGTFFYYYNDYFRNVIFIILTVNSRSGHLIQYLTQYGKARHRISDYTSDHALYQRRQQISK